MNDSATTPEFVTSAASTEVQVNPSPSVTGMTANPSNVVAGNPTKINVSVSGGTAPYSYHYTGLPSGCATVDSPQLNCTPQTAGRFSIKVTVSDSVGETATGLVLLTVTSKPGSSGPTNNSTPTSWLSGDILWVLVEVVVIVVMFALVLMTRGRSGGQGTPPTTKEGEGEEGTVKLDGKPSSDGKPSKPGWSEESEPGDKPTDATPPGTGVKPEPIIASIPRGRSVRARWLYRLGRVSALVVSVSDPTALKMVLVVRGELGLSPGKAAVQVAHAAVMLALEGRSRKDKMFEQWLEQGQKKVALRVPTLTEMEDLQHKARRLGLRTVFVQDAGLTEVPAGTKTVLGIGPGSPSDIDRVTGSLPLL